ncbi:response regulator [Rubellimicrobium roseum]|uniref:response regulator n=1 Tax=Rubellimicrobium roseum TaxID=687525 RepID=UPI00159BA9BC|nr:response regulator [Rubellimicrobium roseum]
MAIFDDDASVLKALARLVQSLGYMAVPCSSLAEFRRHLAATPLDCVILDVHLPDGSGLELLQQLPALLGLPVIMVTAGDDPALRADCMAAGAVAYFVKPLRRSELELVLSSLITLG